MLCHVFIGLFSVSFALVFAAFRARFLCFSVLLLFLENAFSLGIGFVCYWFVTCAWAFSFHGLFRFGIGVGELLGVSPRNCCLVSSFSASFSLSLSSLFVSKLNR
ncbi:hypothetical protein C8J56DRAFT_961171 [Mycena floridula]|nr:hypothetical protein C8J56DRAFT_961171 [Mycena floridula]